MVSNFLFSPPNTATFGEAAMNSIRFAAIFTVCTVDPETMVYKPLNKNQIALSSVIAFINTISDLLKNHYKTISGR
jgi:hypothetical protein